MSVTSVNGQTGVATVDLQNAFNAGPGTLSLNASNLTITDTSSGSQDGVIINTDSTGCALNLANVNGTILTVSNNSQTNGAPLIRVNNAAYYSPTIGAADNSDNDVFPGGAIILKGGDKTVGNALGGGIGLYSGNSEIGQGGGIFISSGTSASSTDPGGRIDIRGGEGQAKGGSIEMSGGSSPTAGGHGGDITFLAGEPGAGGDAGFIKSRAVDFVIVESDCFERGDYSASGYVREKYINLMTLVGSTTAVASQLTFDTAYFDSVLIDYRIKETTTNRIRVGTLMVASDGTNVSITDDFTETAYVGVAWTVALNGTDVEISYTTTANNKEMRADVKSFMAG